MSKTIKVQIILREDSSNAWEKENPVLKKAELGYESNTGRLKIGDGTTKWNSLSYLIGEKVPEGAVFTDTIVNLSNYYTKSEVEALINEKINGGGFKPGVTIKDLTDGGVTIGYITQ